MEALRIENSELFEGVKLIYPPVFRDDRGEFVETFSVDKYRFPNKQGQLLTFKEDDISVSRQNVLRGLHGDKVTWKLIQCLYGEVFFALADADPSSATYLHTQTFILSEANRLQVLVPPNFVNGYLCLSEKCIFSYKQSESYSGMGNQIAVNWNDPKLNIPWPVKDPVLSTRDRSTPNLL